MIQDIKKFSVALAVIFLTISLLVSLLAIWDVIDIAQAKDYLIKIAYTFGAMFIVSLAVAVLKK
jgi:predicted small integral membrane protein